ncbi:MAG: class I SAM-dependent methyltransferase [Pseudomonadota bacterium]
MSEIGAAFDQAATTYDAGRRMLVPGFDDFYGAAIAAVGALDPGARVLDIGAGTGIFAALVSAHWPETEFVLTDLAEGMLAEAQARFASMGVAVPEIVVKDTAEGLPEGPFDAVISALSIHHLTDLEKAATYRRIHQVLRPGGVFVNAEQIAGDTAAGTALFKNTWHKEVRALGATEDMIAAAIDRMRHDKCAPLETQLGWLRDAGFAQVHCSWQRGMFAVITGRAGGPRRSA